MTKHGSATAQDLDDKSLTICSGLDMVNINYLHVVCESAEQAKVRKENLSCFSFSPSCTIPPFGPRLRDSLLEHGKA